MAEYEYPQVLELANGYENVTGNENYIYVAKASDLELVEKSGRFADTSPRSLISGTHQFKAGKGFTKVHFSSDIGQITSEPIGDKGSKSNKVKLVGHVPGRDEIFADFMESLHNEKLLVEVPRLTGKVEQLGFQSYFGFVGADASVSGDGGTAEGGKNGYNLEITCTQKEHFYGGAITEKTV